MCLIFSLNALTKLLAGRLCPGPHSRMTKMTSSGLSRMDLLSREGEAPDHIAWMLQRSQSSVEAEGIGAPCA